MALPAESVTAVVMFILYVVVSLCPLVVNIAWFVLQVRRVHPGLLDVILVVVTVAQSTFSSQLIMTLLLSETPVAPSVGVVELTLGPFLSTDTVLPAPGVSILSDVSVALLLIVWLPSTGRFHENDHVTFGPGQPLHVTPVQAPPSIDISMLCTERLSVAVPLIV